VIKTTIHHIVSLGCSAARPEHLQLPDTADASCCCCCLFCCISPRRGGRHSLVSSENNKLTAVKYGRKTYGPWKPTFSRHSWARSLLVYCIDGAYSRTLHLLETFFPPASHTVITRRFHAAYSLGNYTATCRLALAYAQM